MQEFPVKQNCIFLNHCYVGSMPTGSVEAIERYCRAQSEWGSALNSKAEDSRGLCRGGIAALLGVEVRDISLIGNVAQGLNQIALSYPFSAGDEVLIYDQEYPSNVYPWLAQAAATEGVGHGVVVKRFSGYPTVEEIGKHVTSKTKILALSQVQFTTGFRADLEAIAKECASRSIDLVVDAAQSLGVEPIFPEKWNIAAVVASGWKWLLGPIGVAVMYTSPQFRAKLNHRLLGPDMMVQGDDYLDQRVAPLANGKVFEFSTLPSPLCAGLNHSVRNVILEGALENYSLATISDKLAASRAYIQNLHQVFLTNLTPKLTPVLADPKDRGPILSLKGPGLTELVKCAEERGVIVSHRAGNLRVAPHLYITAAEMAEAAGIISELVG